MNKVELLNELKSFLVNDYNIILIDGPWGSGKTYLLNEFINLKEFSDIKFFYVSLHGLKNIDEINTRIYIEDHKEGISSLLPSVISPFDEEIDVKKVISSSLKLSEKRVNKIVILDDFERYYSSDYDAFLSYLNSLISLGSKVIIVSNLNDFGSGEKYAFDRYKEKLFDRIYKAELFDKQIIKNKFKEYAIYLNEDLISLTKNNYRLVEKIVHFLDEIKILLKKEKLEIKLKNELFYYVIAFISSYYQSDKLYLNKVCLRLKDSEIEYLNKHLDTKEDALELSLICIDHLNSKLNKPTLEEDYKLFLGLYKYYLYAKKEEFIEYIKNHLI